MSELPAGQWHVDVAALIESARPIPRGQWRRYASFAMLGLCVVGAAMFAAAQATPLLIAANMVGVLCLCSTIFFMQIADFRALRREQAALQTLEELMQLRHWPQAAQSVQVFLSRPAKTLVGWVQGMACLAMLLSRYHRFDQAVEVYDFILGNIGMDPQTTASLQTGRAMALLRQDHLFDADRAIADLRRLTRGNEPGTLSLVELYRDVKTGHPAEAIDLFQARLPGMRRQLGHRVADAWGLVARAYDLAGREPEARQAFENATLLQPMPELIRRYPELAPLAEKWLPAKPPAEIA